MAKQFEPELYDIFDLPAKMAVSMYLNSQGIFTLAKEDYAADIISLEIDIKKGSYQTMLHEVEIKSGWSGGPFPKKWLEQEGNVIRIPARKKKLFLKHPHEYIVFWIVSGKLTDACFVGREYLRNEYIRRLWVGKTKKRWDDLYCIPYNLWTFVKLKED